MPTPQQRQTKAFHGGALRFAKGEIMPAIGIPVDDVRGQIIGGDYGQAWVTYEGRKQGPTCYPRTYQEADAMCAAIVSDIKQNCGQVFKDIYPKEAWMFHFDGI